MRYFFLIILFFFAFYLSGQVNADFNLPAEACLDEQLGLENTSVNASSYEWYFCTSDLSGPTINTQQLYSSGIPNSFTVKIVDTGDGHVGFAADRSTNELFRLQFPDGINSAPTFESLGNPGGHLDGPVGIEAVFFNSAWHIFVVNIDSGELVRIDFGSSLGNVPVSFESLGDFGELNRPDGIELVESESGDYFGFVTNEARITKLNFGASVTNTPLAESWTVANASRLWDIELVYDTDRWYGLASGFSNHTVFKLEFSNGLDNAPSITEISIDNSITATNPADLNLVYDQGEYFGLVQHRSRELVRFSFGRSMSSVPEVTDLGFSASITESNSVGFDLAKYESGNWKGFTYNFVSPKLYSFDFDMACSASILSSDAVNPKVSYSASGNYPITLTAYHPNGNSASTTKEITVTNSQAPTGTIDLDNVYCLSDNIGFDFITSDDIATYAWDFGDGSTSNTSNPTHQYAVEGEYRVSLAIESTAGCNNIVYDTVKLLPEPQPEFSTSQVEFCTFESIDFNNITPYDYGDNIVWNWDFNEEGSSMSASPTFTFETAGTKTITLEANVLGCIQTYQSTLTIIDGPDPDFDYDSNCLGEMIQFSNLSTGANITGYAWDFGNGQTSMAENPQLNYNSAGTYSVSLTVTNTNGCAITTSQTIQIYDQVVDSIYATTTVENLPFSLGVDWVNTFDSTQNISYQWEIQGAIQTTDKATYTLSQGTYMVNLEVTTANECLFSSQRAIEVQASISPTPDFNLPAEACLDEQFGLENTSVNASSYEWYFCTSDLSGPTINTQQLYSSGIPNSFTVKIVDTGDGHVGFAADRSTNELFRLQFPDGINSAPTFESLGNPGGHLDGPVGIEAVFFNSAWHIFVVNIDSGELVRIDFGSSLGNVPVSFESLGDFGELNMPDGIELVESESGDYFGFVTNEARITKLNFGASVTNTPLAESWTVANASRLWDIELVYDTDRWYGLASGFSNHTVFKLEFSNGLDNAPSITEISIDNSITATNPADLNLVYDQGEYFGLVQHRSRELVRFSFGRSMSSVPEVTDLGFSASITESNSVGFDLAKYESGNWKGFTYNFVSPKLYSFDFDMACSASILSSDAVNPKVSYSASGNYPITLTAYHPNGNSASTTKEITVTNSQAPTGTIDLDNVYCLSDNIGFDFITSDDIATYAWDFGDGSTSNTSNPTHQYAVEGEYRVSLAIESTAGCNNIVYDTVKLLPEPQPEFSTSQVEFCTFESIDFNNITPYDYGDNIVWNWDFNEEGSSMSASPTFTFETAGTKTITLEANVLGCIQTYQSTLTIIDGPDPDFDYDSNCLGEMIQFSNLSTGANITGYAWDFGNGQTSMAENPQLNYNSAGTYSVSLTVTNTNGCAITTSQTIQIYDQVVDSIYATTTVENLPFSLGVDWVNTFDSTQNISYQWEIQGAIQTTDKATYTLSQGTYMVNLEVTTANECLFSSQRAIEVQASISPTPDFNLPAEACLDEQFGLENTSVNASSYEWYFCTSDLSGPTINTQQLYSSGIPNSFTVKIVDTGDGHVGFAADRSTNELFRLQFPDGINSAPTFESLGNPGGHLDGPVGIEAVFFNSAWHIFVVNIDSGELVRIDFGSSLGNVPVSFESLGDFGELNMPDGIELVESESGDYFGFVTNEARITKLNFGASVTNTPLAESWTVANASRLWDIELVYDTDRWYGLASGFSNHTVFKLEFSNGLDNAPSITEISIDNSITATNPADLNLVYDQGEYFGLVQHRSRELVRFSFGRSMSSVPEVTDLGFSASITESNSVGFDLAKYESGNWKGFTYNFVSPKLYSFDFDMACSASILSSDAVNPKVSYSASGNYPITLTAYHPNGNSASITKEITVTENQAPDINFSVGENLCISSPLQFESQSSAELSAYNWDFGDGQTSTEINPSHTYAAAGTYPVTLSVSDTSGCNNLFVDSVRVYAEPVADFQATSQGSLCSQKTINFENLSNLPTTASFIWDFGDGNTSTEENPEHIYVAEGEYIVNLQIEMAGCLVEKTDTITVNPGPLVDFNYTDDCFGQVVNFENISAGDFLQSFQWNFGDGTQSTQNSPNHSYDSAGTYNVQLTAFTSNGCDYTYQQEVRVNPVATVAFESEVACAGQPMQFNEEVILQESNVTDYLWDFGISGSTSDVSTQANPQFTYPAPGNYQVRLQVTTADGCTSSGTQTVTVNALPQPAFTYDQNCLNNAILFSPENTDNIIAHFWELQNAAGEVLLTSQSQNFSYAFANPGQYQLRYRQQNENLCSNSITETIEMLPLPAPDFELGNVCVNEAIFFENLTDLKGNSLKDYSWSIDGEVISSDFRPQYNFQASGDYLLSLQVETQNGCVQSISKNVSVSPAPEAFFELEQSLAAFPYTLNLTADQSQEEMATSTNPSSPLGNEGLLGIKGLWTLNGDTISTSSELNYTIEQEGTYLLGLTLTNEAGCSDSHYEQIRIRKPNLDIALSNLRITQDQDFTSFVLNVSNRGTLVPERLDLEVDLGSYAVTETVEQALLPESNRNFALSIKLTEEQLKGLAKICIRAIPHNAAAKEENINNNRVCTNIESGLNIMEIYPNPVSTKFTLPIIVPENGSIDLSLEQGNGQTVKTYAYDLEAGYHEIEIDRDNLRAGIYFLRIRYQGEEKVKKIIFQ